MRKLSFQVLLTMLLIVAPMSAFELNPVHPRIFINRESLPALVEKARGPLALEYALIKAAADSAVKRGIGTPRSRYNPPFDMVACGLCCLVEGELGNSGEPYAGAIKRYWGDGKVLGLEGGGFFGWYGLVYDWIFNSLTAEERKKYGDMLGPWLRHYTGVPEITLKGGSWWYNQTWGPSHLNTQHCRDGITPKLFVALALAGAGTDFDSDARSFLASFGRRVPEECIPAFEEMGGVWSESMGHGTYGPVEVIPWAMEAWRTATGQDLFIASSDQGYLRQMTRWAVHLTVPCTGATAWIDDNGGGKPRVFARVAPLLGARFRDPVANLLSDKGWKERWDPIPWARLIWYDPSVGSKTPGTVGWDNAMLFSGAGQLYLRSAWDDPDATWAFFGAGPKLAGHSRDDEGHFMIAKKGWLVTRGGGHGSNEDNLYAGGSLMFNLVTIYNPDEEFRRTEKARRPDGPEVVNNENDGGLIRYVYSSNERDERARMLAYHHNTSLTYAAADITEGYSGSKAREVTRQFIYLPGTREFFVIFDRVRATSEKYPRHWFLHLPAEPVFSGTEKELLAGHVYSSRPGDGYFTWKAADAGQDGLLCEGLSRGFLKALLPERASVIRRGGEGHDFWGHPEEPTAQYNHSGAGSDRPPVVPWRLEVAAPSGEEGDCFLHVIEITGQEQERMSAVDLLQVGGMKGVKLNSASGSINVMFAPEGELRAEITWSNGQIYKLANNLTPSKSK